MNKLELIAHIFAWVLVAVFFFILTLGFLMEFKWAKDINKRIKGK